MAAAAFFASSCDIKKYFYTSHQNSNKVRVVKTFMTERTRFEIKLLQVLLMLTVSVTMKPIKENALIVYTQYKRKLYNSLALIERMTGVNRDTV